VENLRRPLEIPSGFPNEINLKIQSANHLFKNQTFNIISSLFVLLNQVASGDFSPDVLRWRRFGGACRRENFWLPLHALKRLTTASPLPNRAMLGNVFPPTTFPKALHVNHAEPRFETDRYDYQILKSGENGKYFENFMIVIFCSYNFLPAIHVLCSSVWQFLG
jgi:hypothetical protein